MNKSQMIISNGLKYFSKFVDLLLLFVHCTLSYAFLQNTIVQMKMEAVFIIFKCIEIQNT